MNSSPPPLNQIPQRRRRKNLVGFFFCNGAYISIGREFRSLPYANFSFILSLALSPGGNDNPTLPLILLPFPAALLVPSIIDNTKCAYLPALIIKVILVVFLIILSQGKLAQTLIISRIYHDIQKRILNSRHFLLFV